MFYLVNAFSFNMINSGTNRVNLYSEKWSAEEAGDYCRYALRITDVANAIDHESTERVIRGDLKLPDDFPEGRRQTVSLNLGDMILVAQYRGPRLPEGATELPDGATIEYWLITVFP